MRIIQYFIFPLVFLGMFSCAMKQNMQINLNGGGDTSIEIVLEDVFVRYILDLAEATMEYKDIAELQQKAIFDTSEIRKKLSERYGVSIESIDSPEKNKLELKFRFSDLNQLLYPANTPVKRSNLLTFSDHRGEKTFRINLTKENYNHLFELFPTLKNPVFESLAPQPGEDITADEYREVIEFAMDREGVRALDRSSLDLRINVKGKIISHTGGQRQGNTIIYSIPLIDIVVLKKPIVIEIQFK